MSEKPPDPFENALVDLLAPLARVMVARGLKLGSATESTKRALLNAASEAEGPKVSDSRISMMTGLHRKDVRRLRAEDPSVARPKTVNRMAMLISCWSTAPEFQDEEGKPRPLAREDGEEGPGFNALVRRVRLDAAPGTILRALSDQGAVKQGSDGRVRLVADALLPNAGSEELVAAYRATLMAHLTAATHNILAGTEDARHFDRVVRYSHLSDASVAELEEVANAEAQAMLEKLNARAMALQERDAADNARGRFAAGAYVLPTPGPSERDTE